MHPCKGELARFDWADSQGLARGEIVDRNSVNSDWWIKADIRVSQQLPAFKEGHKASAFFVIENFTNMLNDEWGDFNQYSTREQVVEVNLVNDEYVYSNFSTPGQGLIRGPSLWEVRVGINYRF